jgi:ABC-type sugar transport system permease subunit
MNTKEQESLADLQHIKKMMEQSSRFVSLSGLSGIAAGVCALIASFFASKVIYKSTGSNQLKNYVSTETDYFTLSEFMGSSLFTIAFVTLVLAFSLAFLFTFLRSKKHHIPLWGTTAQRLMINMAIPLIAGGVYIYKLMQQGSFGLIAPGCLIFYGLALVNASKYTLGEIRYLGYCEILLGIFNLFAIGYGLYFWAIGFGILHIVYGVYMWNKYERA